MGNETKIKKDNYYLDVNLIGYGERNKKVLFDLIYSLKIKNINKLVSKKNEDEFFSLFDYWDYYYDFNKNFKNQSDYIFAKFHTIKKKNQYLNHV